MSGPDQAEAVLRAWLRDLGVRPHGLRDFGTLGLEAAKRRGLVSQDHGRAAVELLAVAVAALLAAADAMDVAMEPEIANALEKALGQGP